MIKRAIWAGILSVLITVGFSCKKEEEPSEEKPTQKQEARMEFTGAENEVKLITLDPGHFHAALVQKTMYKQISPVVHVYGPEGDDVQDHLKRIENFNNRAEDPTNWEEKVYTGADYLEKMLAEKPGNVVVISGNNRKKAEYIKKCVQAGLNVLADKPMCIDAEGFEQLKEAFDIAEEKGVLIYDIMTERSEITTILQKKLVHTPEVFGELKAGSVDNPAVVKESVHHFFKYVAGNPIKRPSWYFDTTQQGEGIVDVTTHLADLVMWETFPQQSIDYQSEVKVLKGDRWPTMITKEQFQKVTRLEDWPDFLEAKLNDQGILPCYANGQIDYTVNDVHARVVVKWHYQAPQGGGDTHYSIMRGTKANVIIKQGSEQDYTPELYVEAAKDTNERELGEALKDAVAQLQDEYAGVAVEKTGGIWHVSIPEKYRIGHEAHFREVAERYLDYLVAGELPEWEIPNTRAKYYTTTTALRKARAVSGPEFDFASEEGKIDVLMSGKLLTSYRYGEDLTKPVLYPLYSPSGIRVTRAYPLDEIQGESRDHPHHIGLFFTYDDVNGTGFWNNTTAPPQVKHIRVTQMRRGKGKGQLSTVCHWIDAEGNVLLEENRDMVFSGTEDENIIDFTIDLTAKQDKVVFGDTKEGMFAIRVADWLREIKGSGKDETSFVPTGRYLNSNGEELEQNVWGKRAKWVRLQGQKEGTPVGIAMFNYPESVNYPTFWHARGYGLFSANPLGQYVYEKTRGVEDPHRFELTLEKNESAHFEFRVVIYEGYKSVEELEKHSEAR